MRTRVSTATFRRTVATGTPYDRCNRQSLTESALLATTRKCVFVSGADLSLSEVHLPESHCSILTTIGTQLFHHPFVARHGNGNSFAHQFRARVDFGRAREPIEPYELFWLGVRSFRICAVLAFGAHGITLGAAVLAGARHAKVFTLAPPANDLHVLFFAHKSADFHALGRASAMGTACVLSGRHP